MLHKGQDGNIEPAGAGVLRPPLLCDQRQPRRVPGPNVLADRNVRVAIAELAGHEWANVTGEIGPDNVQTMTLSRKLFDQEYTFIVRTIGHEYQHVLQRSQKIPIRDKNEREFLAWSWEALDTSGPQYDLPTAAEHARAALEFYTLMPPEKQKEYEPRMEQLVALIQRLIDQLTARGL